MQSPSQAQAASSLANSTALPLCVDLDGTLLRSDVMVEALVRFLKPNPLRLVQVFGWLIKGPARVKAELARRVDLDIALLPVHENVLTWVREQKDSGRKIVLCTAANERVATQIAAHWGLFDAVIASNAVMNLSGRAKAERLVAQFGRGGFDYAANELKDLPVWSQARGAIVVAGPALLLRLSRKLPSIERSFEVEAKPLRQWLRALRLHQWVKNLLLFVPLAAAHRLADMDALLATSLAFVYFGGCASGTYLLNDLMDLDADRRHPRKSSRPFAAGYIPLTHGMVGAGALIAVSLACAWLTLAPLFTAALLLYVATTVWYSLGLKRIAMVDALALAGLYTVRILAGGAAAGVVPSFWLLAFSMFLFLSLAAAKRYGELRSMLDAGRDTATGRGYAVTDLPLLHSFGITSGYLCVLVLALYVNSGAAKLYSRPQLVWLLCPLLLYWISRVWLKTFRGQMHDDPVIFALTDRPSLLVACLGAALVWAASW